MRIGAGETVSCRSSILIATSNTGAELYRGKALGFVTPAALAAIDREVDRKLAETFRFEFLNRFDHIVHFHPLTREDIRVIARRELEDLCRRPGLLSAGLALEVDESVLDWLALHGYDAQHGARALRRTAERHAAVAIAEAIVRRRPPRGAVLELAVRRNRIAVEVIPRAPPQRVPTAAREVVALPFGASDRHVAADATRVRAEAERLLGTMEGRLAALEQQRAERADVLAALNADGAWDAGGRAEELLARYRELDVTVRVAERLAAPILALKDLVGGGGDGADGGGGDGEDRDGRSPDEPDAPGELEALARRLETAARAARQWDERLAEEDAGGAWLVIARVDPL